MLLEFKQKQVLCIQHRGTDIDVEIGTVITRDREEGDIKLQLVVELSPEGANAVFIDHLVGTTKDIAGVIAERIRHMDTGLKKNSLYTIPGTEE